MISPQPAVCAGPAYVQHALYIIARPDSVPVYTCVLFLIFCSLMFSHILILHTGGTNMQLESFISYNTIDVSFRVHFTEEFCEIDILSCSLALGRNYCNLSY